LLIAGKRGDMGRSARVVFVSYPSNRVVGWSSVLPDNQNARCSNRRRVLDLGEQGRLRAIARLRTFRADASAAGLSNNALEATPGPALANLVPDLALAKKTHTCRFERILETIVQGNESRCPKTCKYHCFADGNQTHRSTACAFFTDDVALRFVVSF
jgi:hypothetical protein